MEFLLSSNTNRLEVYFISHFHRNEWGSIIFGFMRSLVFPRSDQRTQSYRIHKQSKGQLCFCLLSPILLCIVCECLVYLFRTLRVSQRTLSSTLKLSLGLVFCTCFFSVFRSIISDLGLGQTVRGCRVLSGEFCCPL